MKIKLRYWILAVVTVFLVDPCVWVLNHLPIRKKLCWLMRHKYRVIWFKSDRPDAQAGIADTEAGCVFCGHSEPNNHPMSAENIDFKATKHRITPPEHNVLSFYVS